MKAVLDLLPSEMPTLDRILCLEIVENSEEITPRQNQKKILDNELSSPWYEPMNSVALGMSEPSVLSARASELLEVSSPSRHTSPTGTIERPFVNDYSARASS